MKRFHWLTLVALISIALSSVAQIETPEPAPPQKSTDELKSLLIKTYRRNTIASITGPYHLLATFETFTPDGKSADKGSIERWFIAFTRQKTVTHFRDHTMTDYFVDGKHHYTDDGFDGTLLLYRIYESLFESIPLSEGWQQRKLDYKLTQPEDDPLDCILYQLSFNGPPLPIPVTENLCISQQSHDLTLVQTQPLGIQYQDFAPFQEKSIPHTISIASGAVTLALIHVQQMDEAMEADASMVPPADASLVSPGPEWFDITRDEDRPRHRVEPDYSRRLKSEHIEGPVTVLVLRSRTGRIKDIEPLEGPPELVPIVIEAVKNWAYAPLIREDKPVEAISAMQFNFTTRK